MTSPDAPPTTEPSSVTAPSLELHGVSKSFGDTTAVDDLTLRVDNEIIALVGPSGCGKSTLLRLVAGLTPADSGRIVVGTQTVDDGRHQIDPERRNIGLVFQDYALFPHLTIGKNIEFGLDGGRRSHATERDQWLDMVGLLGYADRFPHELSGGERQRVALARALAPKPRVLLLDEPFANLDPNLRASIRSEVVTLLRDTGTPAVFVTHDQTEAMAVGDRIAVMRRGSVEQLGDPRDVFNAPRNRFVASFMGDVSFLPLARSAAGSRCEVGPVPDAPAASTAAVAAVRPDDLYLTPVDDGNADGVPAEIVRAEYRGLSWLCTVRLASGTEVLVAQPRHQPVQPGERVQVGLVDGHHPVAIPEND